MDSLNSETYQLSTCTCSIWAKHFICKHVISIAKMNKLLDIWQALDVFIECNNKKGLTRKEYVHQTKDLFTNLYKDRSYFE